MKPQLRPTVRIVVNVTAEHISRGRRGSPTTCPVALALIEVMAGAKVWVGTYTVLVNDTIFFLPPTVVDIVKRFDIGAKAITPFKFVLEKPHAVVDTRPMPPVR